MKLQLIPRALACVGLALCASGALSQDQGLVLKNGQVNETALLEALVPPPPGGPGKTKSIFPSAASRKPQAHMLMTFETNSAELTPESKKMLDALGHVMQADRLANRQFTVEGHADPRGNEQLNLELSRRRAEAVVSYLEQNLGIAASRLEAVGKGQAEPLKPDDPAAPENRRVTVKTKVQ